jgi:hypothetical protein
MQDRDAGQGDAGQEMQDRRSNPVEDSRFPQCIDRPRKVVGQQRRGAQSPDSVTALGNRFLRPIPAWRGAAGSSAETLEFNQLSLQEHRIPP